MPEPEPQPDPDPEPQPEPQPEPDNPLHYTLCIKSNKREMYGNKKNLNMFLLNSEKSFQDFAFFR